MELAVLGSILGLVLSGLGIWAFVRPHAQRTAAVADAILGEQEVRDRSGKVIRESRPGLVHLQRKDSERLTTVEEAVVEFRHAIGVYTEVLGRISAVEADVASLKDKRVADIVSSAERAATAAASAEMLRLANERDTIDVEEEP